jgi:CheY-like chemotaxis protein
MTGMQSAEGRGHVLVIDDNAGIRRVLGRLLHLYRFTALEATSISEAMASAEQHHLRAIILDLHLGEQSGVDLLARLRQNPRCVATPIVILTGQTVLRDDDEALIRRSQAHVFHKPLPLSTVVEHLTRVALRDN